MNRVADTIARALHAHGIRHAFGMPGGEVVTLVDGLELAGIRFVLARNETAAAMMAAATAVRGDVPGLLVTTLGPGLGNAVNGIADAMQERNPLIVISGIVERNIRARYTHQIIDHAALLRPLVKASFEVEAEGAAAVIARAVALSLASPCGPVHLDLSPAVAAMADESTWHVPARHVRAGMVDAPSLAEVRKLVGAARRPLILAGLEAARAGAGAAILHLAQARGIPVVTTYKGKGVVDELHPLALGAAGLSPKADAILAALFGAADVVLLVGYDPIEMRAGWLEPFAPGCAVIELTQHVADHGMHAATLRLDGPLAALVSAVAASGEPAWPNGEPQAAGARLTKAFAPPKPWGPHEVFGALQAALPGGGIVTVDSGAHRILLAQMWKAPRPFEMLQSAGWCTMGSAIPLAVGSKIQQPDKAVVAVLGDGGLEMTMGELGTLRDQGLAVVVLVLQDDSLALIELKQAQAGLACHGVRMGTTRYDEVARAFGGHGVNVQNRAALDVALAEAFARKECFSLIACQIEPGAYAGQI